MARFDDGQFAEALRFNPKWWWDPIPPWFFEHLTDELSRRLLVVQLEKQAQIVQAELNAIKQVAELVKAPIKG